MFPIGCGRGCPRDYLGWHAREEFVEVVPRNSLIGRSGYLQQSPKKVRALRLVDLRISELLDTALSATSSGMSLACRLRNSSIDFNAPSHAATGRLDFYRE